MARTKTLPIRVNENELATFKTMAQLEKLPVSTFVRRRLLLEAEQRSIIPNQVQNTNSGQVAPLIRFIQQWLPLLPLLLKVAQSIFFPTE